MDQLSAHLDRGWDLVQQGDALGAKSSALRAIELSPEAPEAHNLLGYVAALEGDCEEALEAYEQALLLDDTYVEAMLNAAELYLAPLGEYDEVLRLCDDVLELSEYPDEIVDALLLKFDAWMGKKDVEAARKVLDALPPGPYENPSQRFLVGRACVEGGRLDDGEKLLASTLETQPEHADAHYYLGLVREERGDRRGAIVAFLRCRELELGQGPPPWAPDGETFARSVQQAVESLEPDRRRWLDNAEIYVSDMPGPEMIVDGVDPHALLLLDAPPDEGACARLFVYALSVVKAAGSAAGVDQEIRAALEREIELVFMEPDDSEPRRDGVASSADHTPTTSPGVRELP